MFKSRTYKGNKMKWYIIKITIVTLIMIKKLTKIIFPYNLYQPSTPQFSWWPVRMPSNPRSLATHSLLLHEQYGSWSPIQALQVFIVAHLWRGIEATFELDKTISFFTPFWLKIFMLVTGALFSKTWMSSMITDSTLAPWPLFIDFRTLPSSEKKSKTQNYISIYTFK